MQVSMSTIVVKKKNKMHSTYTNRKDNLSILQTHSIVTLIAIIYILKGHWYMYVD